jgi:hypothetical protein
MLKQGAILLAGLTAVQALGQHQCVFFPDSTSTFGQDGLANQDDQVVFDGSRSAQKNNDFLLVSTDVGLQGHTIPVLTSSKDNVAIHLAVANWVNDIRKVTGVKLEIYNDTLPHHSKSAVVVGTSKSDIVQDLSGYQGVRDDLEGKWESFDVRVLEDPGRGMEQAVVISGSDRVSPACIFEHLADD